MMTLTLVVLVAWAWWNVAQAVFTYTRLGSWCERLIDKATLLSKEEYRRRWDGPFPRPTSIPRPFLRPALRRTLRQVKKTERAFAAVATLVLDQAATDQRERELTKEEELANFELFLADPSLAVELGYTILEHTCRWSRAYRSGEQPGPFTCDICERPRP